MKDVQDVLPPLVDVINSHHVRQVSVPAECQRLLESNHPSLSIDEEIYLRAIDCLAQNKADTDIFCLTYFNTFHKSMPIISQEEFLNSLPHFWSSSDPHLSTLLVSIFLVTRLLPHESIAGGHSPEELYSRVKSIHSMLQSTGSLSIELVQAGILIATYEHCQALHQAAWLSVGACARVAQVLGYHEMLRKVTHEERQSRTTFDTRRCVWWSIVILER